MAKIQSLKIKLLLILPIFFFGPVLAYAATLSLSPASGSYQVGDNFSVKIIASSNSVPFNAVSGLVSFPPSLFSIQSVSKSNSILNFWVTEPAVSKSTGTVKFEGVALGGFAGTSGTVITVNLRANAVGTGTASFESGQILANDGEGTNITGNLSGATFDVKEAPPKPIPTVKTPPTPVPSTVQTVTPPPEITQPTPTLNPPEIMLGTKYGALSIVGSSDYPLAQALVTITALDGSRIFIVGEADRDGSFNIVVPNSLKRGQYNISAVMVKEDKTNSDPSNTIRVDVGNIFSEISWQIQFLIALLILTILYLLVRLHSHFILGNKNGLNKEALEKAKKVIDKSFDLLGEDVAGYSAEKLTLGERRHLAEIKKDIAEAERAIDKKIKDIES